MSIHPLRIFSGSAHPELAQEIADRLGVALGASSTTRLADSETFVMIDEVVRDQDIFIIQSCCAPVNEHVMELLLYLDAFRRAKRPQCQRGDPLFSLCPPGPHGARPGGDQRQGDRQPARAHGRQPGDVHRYPQPGYPGFFQYPSRPVRARSHCWLPTLPISRRSKIRPPSSARMSDGPGWQDVTQSK